MKKFQQYLQEREESGLGDISMNIMDPDQTLLRIAKIALGTHLDDTLNFFGNLAKKDEKIKRELESYDHDKNRFGKEEKEEEKDVVMPSAADTVTGD